MKIVKVTDEAILFDNGISITFDHEQDCCEENYADFNQLDDIARMYNFSEPLEFEAVPGAGFLFGDKRAMFFVPCYSSQNGYYSDEIDIYISGERRKVLSFECEEIQY